MVETYLNSQSFIERGTVICNDDKVWLMITLASKQTFDINQLNLDFKVDGVKILKEIPLDPRHKTKIDYKSLMKLVDS